MGRLLLCISFSWLVLAGCAGSPQVSYAALYKNAQSKFDAGELPAALSLAHRGADQSAGADPSWNWEFRILMADIALWQGRRSDALNLLKNGPVAALSPHSAVRRMTIQARASYGMKDFTGAESILNEADRLAPKAAPDLVGELALARAPLLLHAEDYPAARQLLQFAFEFARKHNDRMLEAKTLGTFGFAYVGKGSYDDALDKLRAGLVLSQSLHARHIETIMLLNTGWNYLEMGDLDQAELLFKSCNRLAEQAGMSSQQENALNSLGRIHTNLEDYKTAADYFSKALAIARQREATAAAGEYLNNLSWVDLKLGQTEQAKKNNAEALSILSGTDDYPEKLRARLNHMSIAIATGQTDDAEAGLQAIIDDPKVAPSLRWESQDELARLLVSTRQPDRAQQQFKKVLNTLDEVRDPIQDEQLRLAFSFWEAQFHTNYIRFLIDQGDEKEALQVAESMQARDLEEGLGRSYRHERLSIPAVQSYLRRHNQVILSYWLASQESYLWAITPSQVSLFKLPSRQEIESKVDHYQAAITDIDDVEKGDPVGQDLFRMLIEPARPLISPGAGVVIIPDGGLGKLNFETLLVPGGPPHFWIKDVELENASSIALLIKPRSLARAGKKLLLIGDPVQANPDYPALGFAKSEIDMVAGHFSPAEKVVITGEAATPAGYEMNAPGGFDVIHFVTHGVASETHPLESAIILSPDKNGAFRLYASDIVARRLNARVVIVSACYGAGRRSYSASGLVGLAWAFLRAASHQVIAGSWKVDDRSTPEFMNDFYTGLKSGQSPSKALRAAKLRMLNSGSVYRLPNFWAALQLYTGS